MGGVAVFLAFMLFAVQLLADLYATSMLTGAAHEAARMVAGASSDHHDPLDDRSAQERAAALLRRRLGAPGSAADLDWSASDQDQVVLRASIPSPSVVPPQLSDRSGGGRIERTVVVRREVWRQG